LNLIQPKRHSAIWHCGPESYQKVADKLQANPCAARGLGLLFAGVGLWLATRASRTSG
jgi:hypothetical protein